MATKSGSPNIGIFSQARMTSSRLPGKILKEVSGIPLLKYHVDRMQDTGFTIVIVTTKNATDDIVQLFCENNNLAFYRGSEDNVLERFYEANTIFGFDAIIRVTSDCPLIDPSLIKEGVDMFLNQNNPYYYVSNSMPRTHARGFDFEIFSAELLAETYKSATIHYDLEHVTPFMRENKNGKMEFGNVAQELQHGNLRICVDTAEDFALVEKLIVDFSCDKMNYIGIENILITHGELLLINKHVIQKGK